MSEDRFCFECGTQLYKRNCSYFPLGFSWFCSGCQYDYSEDQYDNLKAANVESERMTNSLLLAEGYSFMNTPDEISISTETIPSEPPEYLAEFFKKDEVLDGNDPLMRYGNQIQEI